MGIDHNVFLWSPRKDFSLSVASFHVDGTLPAYGYQSVYAISSLDSEALKAAGTTVGFRGTVHSERLWMDIDSYEKADAVEERLNALQLDYVAFDSGNRGGHFGILRIHPPSHRLPEVDKKWVTENFPEADASLYTHLHFLRRPGARHEKTGRVKELVSDVPGRSLDLRGFQETLPGRVVRESRGGDRSIFDNNGFLTLLAGSLPGERHSNLVKAAYILRDSGKSPEFAEEVLVELNKLNREPKPEEDLVKIIKSIFR